MHDLKQFRLGSAVKAAEGKDYRRTVLRNGDSVSRAAHGFAQGLLKRIHKRSRYLVTSNSRDQLAESI